MSLKISSFALFKKFRKTSGYDDIRFFQLLFISHHNQIDLNLWNLDHPIVISGSTTFIFYCLVLKYKIQLSNVLLKYNLSKLESLEEVDEKIIEEFDTEISFLINQFLNYDSLIMPGDLDIFTIDILLVKNYIEENYKNYISLEIDYENYATKQSKIINLIRYDDINKSSIQLIQNYNFDNLLFIDDMNSPYNNNLDIIQVCKHLCMFDYKILQQGLILYRDDIIFFEINNTNIIKINPSTCLTLHKYLQNPNIVNIVEEEYQQKNYRYKKILFKINYFKNNLEDYSVPENSYPSIITSLCKFITTILKNNIKQYSKDEIIDYIVKNLSYILKKNKIDNQLKINEIIINEINNNNNKIFKFLKKRFIIDNINILYPIYIIESRINNEKIKKDYRINHNIQCLRNVNGILDEKTIKTIKQSIITDKEVIDEKLKNENIITLKTIKDSRKKINYIHVYYDNNEYLLKILKYIAQDYLNVLTFNNHPEDPEIQETIYFDNYKNSGENLNYIRFTYFRKNSILKDFQKHLEECIESPKY